LAFGDGVVFFELCILVSEEDEEAIVVEPSKRGKLFFLSVA